jgi:hypothetical protein
MAQYHQLFQEGDRQQQLADMMLQKAIQPRGPQQTGRIASEMHWGEGLAQLGEAMLARRQGKKASATTAQAEEQRRQAQAAALSGMSDRPEYGEGPPAPFNPYAQAQGAMESGVDPNVVQSYLKSQDPEGADGGTSLAGYRQAKEEGYEGSYLDYKREFEGREANRPSTLQEWDAYNAMTPEQKAQYLEMKRTGQLATIGGVPNYVPPGAGSGVSNPRPLGTLEDEEEAKRRLAQQQALGTETGGAQGTAIANLPAIQNTTRAALETVEKMLEHPGMGTATGLSGVIDPRNYIPGTEARNFQVLKNQAQGQVFLDAFQSLKGGGTVTEIEGLKAEQAKARMDTAQSDEEFRMALNDYANALRRGLQLAEQRAGMVTGGGFGGEQPPGAPGAQQQPGSVNWNDL